LDRTLTTITTSILTIFLFKMVAAKQHIPIVKKRMFPTPRLPTVPVPSSLDSIAFRPTHDMNGLIDWKRRNIGIDRDGGYLDR
jgi:hypothetical protein